MGQVGQYVEAVAVLFRVCWSRHTHAHTQAHAGLHTHIHRRSQVHVPFTWLFWVWMHTYVCVHPHMQFHTAVKPGPLRLGTLTTEHSPESCMYSLTHTHICTHLHTHAQTHSALSLACILTPTHTHTHICTHMHTHADTQCPESCMYSHTHTHTHTSAHTHTYGIVSSFLLVHLVRSSCC